MARQFELSRASIFNVLKQAEAMGLTVHAVRGRGYKLPESVNWLDKTAINAHLGAASDDYTISVVDSVDSTNRHLMLAALDGAADGTVLCAEHQHAGKGRRGRVWHAVPGGSLTFSVLWRFDDGLQSLAGLSLAVGLAIARAINRHSRYPVSLKWPNDLLVGYRKLAGILVEVQGDMHGPAFAVVGIGMNVRLTRDQRNSIDQAVVDLSEMDVKIDRNQLLADCLKELHHVLTEFRHHGFSALRADWMSLDAYANKQVVLQLPNTQGVHGIAAGVDDTGALLIRNQSADTQAYSGGEISLRLAGHTR